MTDIQANSKRPILSAPQHVNFWWGRDMDAATKQWVCDYVARAVRQMEARDDLGRPLFREGDLVWAKSADAWWPATITEAEVSDGLFRVEVQGPPWVHKAARAVAWDGGALFAPSSLRPRTTMDDDGVDE